MRLVAEHKSEGPRETDRVVRLYTGGVREVINHYGNGESWSRYIIFPRLLMLNEIRKQKARGRIRIDSWTFWDLLPEGPGRLIHLESYRGPGQPFAHRPNKIRTRSRKFIVIYQSGGLDI